MQKLIDEITWHINHSNFLTKSHIVTIMMNLRKILEIRASATKYPYLKLYCDWCVHTEIDRSEAAFNILTELNEVMIKETEAGRPSQGDCINIASHLHSLRDDIIGAFNEYNIPDVDKFQVHSAWSSFVSMLIYSLGDTRIKFPDAPSKTVKAKIISLENQLQDASHLAKSFGFVFQIIMQEGTPTHSIQLSFIIGKGASIHTNLIVMTTQGLTTFLAQYSNPPKY